MWFISKVHSMKYYLQYPKSFPFPQLITQVWQILHPTCSKFCSTDDFHNYQAKATRIPTRLPNWLTWGKSVCVCRGKSNHLLSKFKTSILTNMLEFRKGSNTYSRRHRFPLPSCRFPNLQPKKSNRLIIWLQTDCVMTKN